MRRYEVKVVFLFALTLCVFLAVPDGFAQEGAVLLRSGTPVLLKTYDTITSKTVSLNQIVKLRVIREVKVEDHIVVPFGADGDGKITKVKRPKGWGGKGKLEMVVSSVTAIDGTEVLLSAQQRSEGEGRVGTATAVGVGTGLLCLPFAVTGFLIRGE
jgi:hypothetical protein